MLGFIYVSNTPVSGLVPLNADATVLRPLPRVVIVAECHGCGYEADGSAQLPRRCPKCGGSAWSQFARLVQETSPRAPRGDRHARRGPYHGQRRLFDRPAHHISRPAGGHVAFN